MGRKRRVGVLVFDGVTLLDLAGPSEVFAEANDFGAGYEVRLYSADGGDVVSSTGMRFSVDGPAADSGRLEIALVARPGGAPQREPGGAGLRGARVSLLPPPGPPERGVALLWARNFSATVKN